MATSSESLPWYKWFPTRSRTSLRWQSLSLEARGLFRELYDMAAISKTRGSLVAPEGLDVRQALAAALGMPVDRFDAILEPMVRMKLVELPDAQTLVFPDFASHQHDSPARPARGLPKSCPTVAPKVPKKCPSVARVEEEEEEDREEEEESSTADGGSNSDRVLKALGQAGVMVGNLPATRAAIERTLKLPNVTLGDILAFIDQERGRFTSWSYVETSINRRLALADYEDEDDPEAAVERARKKFFPDMEPIKHDHR